MQNVRLIEVFQPIWTNAPANYSGTANTITYVSLKGYERLGCLITTGAWAGGTAAVTALQATAVAGTGSKALAFSWVWISSASGDVFTKTAVVSNTFNLTTANTNYWIEFVQSDLDVDNVFTSIGVNIATPGSNADFYATNYFGCYPKYPMPAQIDANAN